MKGMEVLQKVYHKKAALRKTFLDIDESESTFLISERTGLILQKVFFEVLSYNHILISQSVAATLSRLFGKQNRILYKEALAQLFIDFDQPDPLNAEWILRQHKPQRSNLSSRSQLPKKRKASLEILPPVVSVPEPQQLMSSTMPELKDKLPPVRSPSEITFGNKAPKHNRKMHDVFYFEGEPNYNFVTNQYYDYDNLDQYKTPVLPEVVKRVKKKQSKQQDISEIIERIRRGGLTDDEITLLGKLFQAQIDNRMLENAKLAFMKCDTAKIGILQKERFRDIMQNFMKGVTAEIEELALRVLQDEQDNVVLAKLVRLVELQHYYPLAYKMDRNASSGIYQALGATKGTKPVRWDQVQNLGSQKPVDLKALSEYFWVKVHQRFTKMSDTFRFFDSNNDGKVTLQEFEGGLNNLSMTLHSSNLQALFRSIDKQNQGYFDYRALCDIMQEQLHEKPPPDVKKKRYFSYSPEGRYPSPYASDDGMSMKDLMSGQSSKVPGESSIVSKNRQKRSSLFKVQPTIASIKRAEAMKQKMQDYEESEWKINRFLKVQSKYKTSKDSLSKIKQLSAIVSQEKSLILPSIKPSQSPPRTAMDNVESTSPLQKIISSRMLSRQSFVLKEGSGKL